MCLSVCQMTQYLPVNDQDTSCVLSVFMQEMCEFVVVLLAIKILTHY